jgi:solute carrier family 40 (iron-regulated transporter), member 1
MTTYLLSRHYSLSLITFARTVISIMENSSTITFPIAASFLAKYPLRLIPDPIVSLGLSGVSTQVAFTIPCYIALILVPINMTDPASAFPLLSASILLSLGFSGFGYWTHNVAVQQIVQTRVSAARRVRFAGVETTFASAAEIGRWASTAIWSRPEQFGGVATGRLVSVVICWLLYAVWIVRLRRKIVLETS